MMTDREYIRTDGAPRNAGINAGHFSQAVRVGNTVYIGGTLAIDPKTMELIKNSPYKEILTAYNNLKNICVAAGGTMQDIVMLYALLTDLSYLSLLNEIQAGFINEPHPPRSVMKVAELPHGNHIELVATMILPSGGC